MKLIFSKNEKQEISVASKDGDSTKKFDYVFMIKRLIDLRQLEEPEFNGDFSESEKESVRSMVKHINDEVTEFYSDDDGAE